MLWLLPPAQRHRAGERRPASHPGARRPGESAANARSSGHVGGPEPPAPPVPNRGGHGVKRTQVYLTALAGFGGMLLLAGTSQGQAPGGGMPPAGGAAPAANTVRPVVAVFNMAAVMREFGQAKYQVY